MECPVCGFKSYPQWLNDQAHCLKCDTVVKTRASCHDRPNSPLTPTHIMKSPVTTPKDRDHEDRKKIQCPTCGFSSYPQWLNDKAHCLKCDTVVRTRANPIEKKKGFSEAERIKFQFARLDKDKSGCLELSEMSELLRKGDASLSDEELQTLFDGVDKNHDGTITFDEFVDFIHKSPRAMTAPGKVTAPQHRDFEDRVKMECPTCGFKSYPQWLNDQAHCLKCDTVLKKRPNINDKANW